MKFDTIVISTSCIADVIEEENSDSRLKEQVQQVFYTPILGFAGLKV